MFRVVIGESDVRPGKFYKFDTALAELRKVASTGLPSNFEGRIEKRYVDDVWQEVTDEFTPGTKFRFLLIRKKADGELVDVEEFGPFRKYSTALDAAIKRVNHKKIAELDRQYGVERTWRIDRLVEEVTWAEKFRVQNTLRGTI